MRISASPKFLLSRNVIIAACEIILKSNPPGCQAAALASKRFFEWTQIHLLRPCRAPLPMNIPIGVSDGVDAEQAGLAAFRGQVGHPAEQPKAAFVLRTGFSAPELSKSILVTNQSSIRWVTPS